MQRKTLICLTITVLVYLVTGGAIFHYLEDLHRSPEIVPDANKSAILNLTLEFKAKYAGIEDSDITEFITKVITAYENGEIEKTELDRYKQLYTWDMFNSFYFACSIITTIGYGHITPRTVGGMAFTIVYAFIGIPISMLMLAGMGEKLSRSTKVIEDKMLLRTGKPRLAFATRFIFIFVGGKVVLMLMPAVIFMYTEGWDMGQGFYYSLITLSTIGLGDRVAGTTTTRLGNSWTEVYRITLILWIYFGMAWVAMCINFIKDWLETYLDHTTDKVTGSFRNSLRTTKHRNRELYYKRELFKLCCKGPKETKQKPHNGVHRPCRSDNAELLDSGNESQTMVPLQTNGKHLEICESPESECSTNV